MKKILICVAFIMATVFISKAQTFYYVPVDANPSYANTYVEIVYDYGDGYIANTFDVKSALCQKLLINPEAYGAQYFEPRKDYGVYTDISSVTDRVHNKDYTTIYQYTTTQNNYNSYVHYHKTAVMYGNYTPNIISISTNKEYLIKNVGMATQAIYKNVPASYFLPPLGF